MGRLYSILATCLILIALCEAAVKPFTKFCKLGYDEKYDEDCKRLVAQLHRKFVDEKRHLYFLPVADKLEAIKEKLMEGGCGTQDATGETVCKVKRKNFEKSLTVGPIDPKTIQDEYLRDGVKDTMRLLQWNKKARSASFILGPSACGKSTITSTIAGGIKYYDQRDVKGNKIPIFTIDGDDFREGYEPYQELVQISQNFPCSLDDENVRCVFNFWEMSKFKELKKEYIKRLWERAKQVQAHLIIPQTPEFFPSTIYKDMESEYFRFDHGYSYKPFIYRIQVTKEDQKLIQSKGIERGGKSGKEYKNPAWYTRLVSRCPKVWPNTHTWPDWGIFSEYSSEFIDLKYKAKPEKYFESTIEKQASVSDDLPTEEISHQETVYLDLDLPEEITHQDTLYLDLPEKITHQGTNYFDLPPEGRKY